MHARPRRSQGNPPPAAPPAGRVDVNAVVSYNLRAIRESRGWTQAHMARRLAELTGHELPSASIGHMERGFAEGRRRRFDAHEIYLLSVVFDVPLVYFFLPPPAGTGPTHLRDTGAPLPELYAAVLGTDEQLVDLDARLGEVRVDNPEAAEAVVAAVFGVGPGWVEEFRAWRRSRLLEVSREYGVRLADLAGFLRTFAEELAALGPRAYMSSQPSGVDEPFAYVAASAAGRQRRVAPEPSAADRAQSATT